MALPTPSTLPTPVPVYPVDNVSWSNLGNIVDPGLSQRTSGWVNVLGQNYGQLPPYKWENYMKFVTGEWVNYENAFSNYIVQCGVVPWLLSPPVKYQSGSIVQDGDGVLYTSLIDDNNFPLPIAGVPQPSWSSIEVPSGFNVGVIPIQGLVSSTITNLNTASSADGCEFLLTTADATLTSVASFSITKTRLGTVSLVNDDLNQGSFEVRLVVPSYDALNPAAIIEASNSGIVNFPFGILVNSQPILQQTVASEKVTIYGAGAGQTFVPDPKMRWCTVEICGGGGGGGGFGFGNFTAGGGAGAYSRGIFGSSSIPPSVTIDVGAGGTSGQQTNGTGGGNGGESNFGTLIQHVGGGGGGGGSQAGSINSPGAAGIASTSAITYTPPPPFITNRFIINNMGFAGFASVANGSGGAGANSALGVGGAVAPIGTAPGNPGTGYGSGGGGSSNSGGDRHGALGQDGVCIITEYLSI